MRLDQFHRQFFSRVDNGPLVLFRAFFGLLLFLESAGAIATGWVNETFVEARINFTFIGFEWLAPPPGNLMYFYYGVMAAFGFLVMVGLFYRLSITLFTVMWTASYLMQKAHYNNHYYLLIILCLLMMLCPAQASFSMDSRRNSALRSQTCPAWCYWIFIVQLLIVYLAASLSKIYPDWLAGDPIRIWMKDRADFPLLGGIFQQEWWHFMVAYGGILFDGLVIPGLLWRRTRNFTLALSILFHLHNSIVFQIGIFPYLMIACSLFFYPPAEVNKVFFSGRPVLEPSWSPGPLPVADRLLLTGFLLFFMIQIWLPIRHHFYEGNVHWTEEGHRLAWKMMLRAKSGYISFEVKDPQSGKTRKVNLDGYLTPHQKRQMPIRPDMIWQFVQILKEDLADQGITNPEIYATSMVRLNARPSSPLVNPEIDLAKVEWYRFRHADWLLPMPELSGPKPNE